MRQFVFLISSLLLTFVTIAQPQSFNYQAVIRDNAGNPLVEKRISLQIDILSSSKTGNTVYSEEHSITTNAYGLINLNIGLGEVKKGSFNNIQWGIDKHFIRILLDEEGGTNFKEYGVSQLLSVPYAMYSMKSGNESDNRSLNWGNWNNDIFTGTGSPYPSGNVGIGTRISEGRLTVFNSAGYTSVFRRVVNSPGNALFLLQKARGDIFDESPVQADDHLGQIRFEGYYDGDYQPAAYIRSSVEALNGSTVKGNLRFATMTDTGMTEHMLITNEGNIGMGTTTPQATLDIQGTFRYVDGSEGADKVLKTDATGQTTWESVSNLETDPVFLLSPANSITITHIAHWETAYGWGNHANAGYLTSETDPKIASATSNSIPKWDGSQLTDGSITDNGNVGVGTTLATEKLEVNGNIKGMGIVLEDANGRKWLIKIDTMGNLIMEPEWLCGDTLYDSRNGQGYPTVQIGGQCWMAENLNLGNMISISNDQTDNGTIEKYCYDNNISNCNEYGGLYVWDEAMNYATAEGSQGICPDNWHIPTEDEFEELGTFLGGRPIAGGKLKETGTAHWQAPNMGATNSSGFTALPAGSAFFVSGYPRWFQNITVHARFWSSTYNGTEYRFDYMLSKSWVGFFRGDNSDPNIGESIRCIKD